jgi:hypothetical protein
VKVQDVTSTIQAIGAVGGLVFAALAYFKARAVAVVTAATHDLVNGASIVRVDAAYAQGGKDQRQDARDAAKLARDLAADAAALQPPQPPPAV